MFRARTAQNIAIVVGLSWLTQLLQIATKVVLARLLFPDDFGIFALASGLISFVNTFGAVGLNYAIIQKGSAATKEDYDVGMTLRLLVSIVLLVGSLVVAGPWAALYNSPLVAPTTQVLALLYLISPWGFIPSTRLSAELRYRTQLVPSLAGQLTTAAASILLAVLGFSVWALVYGLVLGQIAFVAGYCLVSPFKWHPSLRWPVARPLLAYSQYLLSAAVLAFLITNIDNFAVGFLLGTKALGFYAVAYGIGFIPVALVSTPAGSALFPSLTKIQGDTESLRGAYLESFGYAVAIIAPAGIGLAVTAPEIVRIVLGPTWIPATLSLMILGFYGLVRGLTDFSSSLFSAVGKPRILAELNLYILLLSVVPLFLLTSAFGIAGTAVAMTVPVGIAFGLSVVRTTQVLKSDASSLLGRGVGPLLAAETMGIIVFGVRTLFYSVLPPRIVLPFGGLSMAAATAVFLIVIPVGIAAYFALLRLFDRDLFAGFWRHIWLALRPRHAQLASEEP